MPKHSKREAITSNVIKALRLARQRKGLSMTVVAERAGLHVSMISLVERELRKPTLDTLLRIAEALEVNLANILKKAIEDAHR